MGIELDSMAGGETATATKMAVDDNDNGDANDDDEFIRDKDGSEENVGGQSYPPRRIMSCPSK